MATQPTKTSDENTVQGRSPLALVKHLRGDGMTVIDARGHQSLGQVGSGRQPHAFAVHPGGRWGYLPAMGSNTLEVVDLERLTVATEIGQDEIGTAPVGAELTRAGEYLLVTCYGELPDKNSPGIVAFATDDSGGIERTATLPLGKAAGITVDVRNDIWVALTDANEIVCLSGRPPFKERNRISVPTNPQDIAYAPAYGLLGVNNVDDDSVTFIDTLSWDVVGTITAPNPRGGTVVPAADRWFVGNTEGDGLTAIDLTAIDSRTGSGEAQTRIPLGTATAFTDVTPDGRLLAVDAYEDDRVTFLDPCTLEVVAKVKTGQSPHHPRFSADGAVCYVPNVDDDTVSVVSTVSLHEGESSHSRPGTDAPTPHAQATASHTTHEDSHSAELITIINLPDDSAPSGCFRTDRRGIQ